MLVGASQQECEFAREVDLAAVSVCGRETENNPDGCCEKNTQDATFKGDIGWPKFWVFSSQGCEIGYLVTSAPSGLAGVQAREFMHRQPRLQPELSVFGAGQVPGRCQQAAELQLFLS